jgi:hypothetical protein
MSRRQNPGVRANATPTKTQQTNYVSCCRGRDTPDEGTVSEIAHVFWEKEMAMSREQTYNDGKGAQIAIAWVNTRGAVDRGIDNMRVNA